MPPPQNSSEKNGWPRHLADLVQLHDIGVLQSGPPLPFRSGSAADLRGGLLDGADHLEGDNAVGLELPAPVDHAHAALAEDAENRRSRARRGYSWLSPGVKPVEIAPGLRVSLSGVASSGAESGR